MKISNIQVKIKKTIVGCTYGMVLYSTYIHWILTTGYLVTWLPILLYKLIKDTFTALKPSYNHTQTYQSFGSRSHDSPTSGSGSCKEARKQGIFKK